MDNISNNIDDVRGQLNYEYTTDTTKRIIKVIGVGGGGGNAVSTMYKKEMIKGVSFLLCNTDEQALNNSPVPNKITLGPSITKGLGAGYYNRQILLYNAKYCRILDRLMR